jgi:RNA polymerase sigma factor (sigma-70 family)
MFNTRKDFRFCRELRPGPAFRYNRRNASSNPLRTFRPSCVLLQADRSGNGGHGRVPNEMDDKTPGAQILKKREREQAPELTVSVPDAGSGPVDRPVGEVYTEFAPLLRRVAIRKFGVPIADAESLVHDVFISYLSDPRRVRTNLRGYLIASMCNASRRYWNSRNSESRIFAGDLPVDDLVAEETFDGLDTTQLVAATLARLPARYREVLRRYYLDGQNTKTIADAMGTTPTNVNYLMHVCRVRAREIYHELNRVP